MACHKRTNSLVIMALYTSGVTADIVVKSDDEMQQLLMSAEPAQDAAATTTEGHFGINI